MTVSSLPTLVPRATSTQWADFEHALAQLVEVLDSDQFLIIESRPRDVDDGARPYVQLAIHEAGIYAETVSNHFLGPSGRLDRMQKRRLVALGWTAPVLAPHDPDANSTPRGSTNYSRRYEEPLDAAAIASDLVVALRDVYEVDRPRDLEYHAFSEHPAAMIVIPTLGIRRARFGDDVKVEDSPAIPELDDEFDDELDDAPSRTGTAGYL